MAQTVTAADVGHDSAKFLSLRSSGETVEIVRAVSMPLDELGRLADGPERSAALKARLGKFAAETGLRPGHAVVPISGRTTMLRYIPVPPVPPWRLDAMMRFEATEQSSSRVNDETPQAAAMCAYDYRMVDTPDIEGQSTVLLVMGQDAAVAEKLLPLRSVGVSDPDVDLAAMGLFNAYVLGHGADDDLDKTVMLVDIGASEINIVIAKNGGLYFARHQGGGGASFTKGVQEALSVPWAEAERYKIEKGSVPLTADEDALPKLAEEDESAEADTEEIQVQSKDPNAVERDQTAAQALVHEASNMARAVEATIMYARAQTKIRDLKIDKVYLSGGGSKLKGLPEFLGHRFGVSAGPLEPLKKISLGELSSDEMKPLQGTYSAFAIPVGLALSRVVEKATSFDIRRETAKVERTFRQRDLYLWAAAVILGVTLIFWVADGLREGGATARAKAVASDLTSEDETVRKGFESARRRNVQLRANLEALRDRVTSGEDILRVLSQLKKRTPQSIRLVELSTTRPKLGGGEDEEGGTFQANRVVYVRGYATSRDSLPDAFRMVKSYRTALEEAKELFERVEQVKMQDTRADRHHVAQFVIALNIARSN